MPLHYFLPYIHSFHTSDTALPAPYQLTPVEQAHDVEIPLAIYHMATTTCSQTTVLLPPHTKTSIFSAEKLKSSHRSLNPTNLSKMATHQTPYEYWITHPNYWIAARPEIRVEADHDIYTKFFHRDIAADHWIDQVIFLDQFTRHFSRASPQTMSEDEVALARIRATEIVKDNSQHLPNLTEFELVFCLMPFKHTQDYEFIFETIHTKWLPLHLPHIITHHPLLTRFYKDTYEKCYYDNPFIIYNKLLFNEEPSSYEPQTICDYYPAEYTSSEFTIQLLPPEVKPLAEALTHQYEKSNREHFILSLSGGVDSMVMCYILKALRIPFVAAHIIYGNRPTSEQEYAFIRHYCHKLHVSLYAYRIEWLRRAHIEREFYEEATRNIRFKVYNAIPPLIKTDPPHVLLGHIQEDVVENIWTNLAHATHLNNLAKMSPTEEMDGVIIHRPWLSIKKALIYQASQLLKIPYLKNTTPLWSNRGKFREHFYKATHDQFGESTDTKVIEAAAALAKQSALIDKILFTPLFESWNPATQMLDATRAFEAALDGEGWSRIFTYICHTKLHISKPSIHACRDFAKRSFKDTTKMILKKDLHIVFYLDGERKILHFVTPPPQTLYSSSSQSESQ